MFKDFVVTFCVSSKISSWVKCLFSKEKLLMPKLIKNRNVTKTCTKVGWGSKMVS